MSYDTNVSTGPIVSMGTSYDTVDILRPDTAYDSYQAEHGEAACLAVLARARAWWPCNLVVVVHVCCCDQYLLGRQALTKGRGEAKQDFCANMLGAKQQFHRVSTDQGAAPAKGW